MANAIDGGASNSSNTSNNPWSNWSSNSTKYEEIDDPAGELADKYKSMVHSRIEGGEDIDISKALPRLEEMFTDDLIYDFYKDITGKDELSDEMASKDKEVTDAIFYNEEPNLELGYHDDNTFTLELTGNVTDESLKHNLGLNKVDGDTTYLDFDNINDGGQGFTMKNGMSFDNFKSYCETNNLSSSNLGIRFVGIDAPELPHKDIVPMTEDDIVKMTLGEAKKQGVLTLNYNYNKENGTVSDRNDSTEIEVYKTNSGMVEVLSRDGANYLSEEDKSSLESKRDDKEIFYGVVLTQKDESEKGTLADGYAAQKNLHDLLKRSKKTILKLDANGTKANKTTGKHKLYYNHWWNGHKVVSAMIDQWNDTLSNKSAPLTRLSYDPFGTDGYGRFLGEIYVLVEENGKDVWINVNKYVLSKSTGSVANPDFSDSPELNNIYGDVSNSFELWTYDKDNLEYLDSFMNQTKENYTERNELHKKVTGIDFAKFRNCTLMLGDTLFLIPPTSIRNVSGVEYEKVPILRGKGSMVKGITAKEQYLEIDLYFYDEYGINGIRYDHVFPNGKTMTYFLDGLRALIAQFKVAPYLPIENKYVNDVLGIEAVSLVNLNVRTVEGFPRLLQATLTLRSFNYRIFMPDVPLDYKDKELSDVSEMNPIFAKCFNWEIFRYYYQRAILRGEKLSQYDYNTREYFDEYYSGRLALKHVGFCDSSDEFSLYVPDENWLKNALSIKKDSDYYAQQPQDIEMSESMRQFLKDFGVHKSEVKLGKKEMDAIIGKCHIQGKFDDMDYEETYGYSEHTFEDIMNNKALSKETHLNLNGVKGTARDEVRALLNTVISSVESASPVLMFSTADETHVFSDHSIRWDVHFRVKTGSMTAEEFLNVREILRDLTGDSNIANTLEDEMVTIQVVAKVEPEEWIVDSIALGSGGDLNLLDLVAKNNELYDGETTSPNETNKTVEEEYDYKNPAAMHFYPYVENVPIHSISFGMTNNFTEMTLKMMDGSAPQYMGSSDISIEIRIITEDATTISMLNVLPDHTMNLTKTYRKILNCYPLRIKNGYLQMIGLNEVIIDSIQIENMDGYPGVYDVRMRFTSVDRAMRQREMLKQIESKQQTTHFTESNIGTYFDIEESLSYAETYPDLDIPSLDELSQLGYKFIKYNKSSQIFPDPDFYILYGYEYTAQIIKRNIKEVFLNKLFHCTENENKASIDDLESNFYMQDDSGQLISTKITSNKGLDIIRLGGAAEYYTEKMNEAAESGSIEIVKSNGKEDKSEDKEYDESTVVAGTALEYLILGDVQEGWELKPGWIATMAPLSTNESVSRHVNSNLATDEEDENKDDLYAEDIFNRRKRAIELIDAILSEPIDYGELSNNDKVDPRWYRTDPFNDAVKLMFKQNDNGKELIKLLCPLGDVEDMTNFKWEKHGEYASKMTKGKVLDYIQHFLHASACTLSGDGYKTSNGDYMIYGAKQFYSENKDKDGKYVPYCLCEYSGKSAQQAKTYKDAIEHGVQFGMCQIRREAVGSILKRIEPRSKIDYLGEGKTHKMYSEMKDGFIDPYYNKLKDNSDELKKYMQNIASYPASNAYAFLRIMLVYLRKQIIDGYHISEIDILGSDNEAIYEMLSDQDVTFAEFKKGIKDAGESGNSYWDNLKDQYGWKDYNKDGDISFWEGAGTIAGYLLPGNFGFKAFNAVKDSAEDVKKEIDENEIEDKTDGELDGEFIVALRDSMGDKFAKSYCARWIYPFLEAATQTEKGPSSTVISYFDGRKFDELNVLTSSLLSSATNSTELITKFLLITAGSVTNLNQSESDPSTTSDAQKIMNSIMREAYTGLSEDPQAYVLHSFYDMLTNDKRGRLVRAFPTYYVVFIDEGRKIGSWKLFDNFYNMSAISELTVTKSRKIPADTCSFVMTNMFNSYAGEYDNSTRENYVDVYNIKDVFTSVLSPTTYVSKEDALRRRKKNLETTVLRPGVRLHIRMGYGSNAGRLPVVFNGRIAEIDVGDVVTVVGQGDGIELTNPLNALGEIDATNLTEAQSWTTIAKDLRGSLSRGGLSPRNLLAKLLTAKHGGMWKTGIREIFDERWYGDNPFGIYHFGDKRFNLIFTDGEPVQNLFEVVDGTLLSGTNELYASKETTEATPTINTNLQDKTFWDVLTMCAYSGVGYIGAIRDFGFRSTVCLCKRNHYYAYKYEMIDGKYTEKRKPFQQFHYYDSYTDIIYNSIKASDKNIKTNAVGIWEGTDVFWGQEQKTCGPLYLDINIYPEYQKAMTVDTGLIAAGNGGIDIPFTTHYSEEWNLNANADKVNKSLAERITANSLRESLTNMYSGEICVVGDPSIKPYDRFSITDVYEDMCGQMEVEAVVYSMNFNTGFTTTIYPDLIVRQDDPLEPVAQNITGNVVASIIATVTARLGLVQSLASVESKVITTAANLAKPLFKTMTSSQIINMFGKTAFGKVLGTSSLPATTTGTGGVLNTILNGLKLSKGNIYVIVAMIIIAVTCYVMTKNAKSFLTRWVRNIQMLDVYPIFKNQRPFIAGLNGHKGCVVGYNYTEEDVEDSIQGMIVKCVEKVDSWHLGGVLNVFLERDAYNQAVFNWSNTLTSLNAEYDEQNKMQQEAIAQEAYSSVTKEYAGRSSTTAMVNTKYRIQSFNTNNGTDKTYLHYRNMGVIVSKDVKPALIKGTNITTSSFYTNQNILGLYPVEDDPEIKKAISGNHPVVKSFDLLHSTGNKRDGLAFESGYRVIRYIVEENPNSTYADYRILDLPMIQEDAMYVLKFILNDEHLKKKKISFLSGTRVNDARSWKNTGFAFEIQCDDKKALEEAVKAVKKNVYWKIDGKQVPIFNYKMTGDICAITVYAEKVNEVNKN